MLIFDKRYKFHQTEWFLDIMRLHRYGDAEHDVNADTSSAVMLSKKEKKADSFRLETKNGKITDAGYDQFRALYTSVPADKDFTIKAKIRITSFPEPEQVNGQEGFGVFIRDTMKPDPETGLYYSNMAAAGGYHGTFNFFGRDGITEDSFENVRNFVLNHMDQDGCAAIDHKQHRTEIMITLTKKGSRVCAQISDQKGNDILGNQGEHELSSGAFKQRDPENLYVGFFAARGAGIEIDRRSVRLTIRRKTKGREKETLGTSEQRPWQDGCKTGLRDIEAQSPDIIKRPDKILYASPAGKRDANGTERDPMDLMSAAEICPAGGEIRLLPGHYAMEQSLVLGPRPTEKAGGDARGLFFVSGVSSRCTRLIAQSDQERGAETGIEAILDFQGTQNCLLISGNDIEVEDISVTGGYGIWLTGSDNKVSRCRAFRNIETGILIRSLRNDVPAEKWPSNNLIEDCISCENCDDTGSNADGFACKVAAGCGNRFVRCKAYLNTDDGFDLFAKNKKIGAVQLQDCASMLNGWLSDENGKLVPSNGNGNGFKLGGSGLAIRHQAAGCIAEGNRASGFTSNSNPVMLLQECISENNGRDNFEYYYYSAAAASEKIMEACTESTQEGFDTQFFYQELLESDFL